MQMLIWAVPLALVLLSLVLRIRRTYKHGLFQALLQLATTAVSAVIAFVITRLALDPASTDLFGLGQKLFSLVPEAFVAAVPEVEALIRALPTAVAALIAFPLLFGLLRKGLDKLLDVLGEKYHWEQKFSSIANAQKWLALIPGLFSACLALLVEMVLIGGCIHLAANLMAPAQYVVKGEAMEVAAGAVMDLAESPAIRITDSLGCQWAFEELTTAQREGKEFSVGREIIDWSRCFMGLGKMATLYESDGTPPDGDTLRALGDALTEDPHTVMLANGLVHANVEALTQSDAIVLVSGLLGTTPQRFHDYMLQVDDDQLAEDIHTFCNLAALLADRGLIPAQGQQIDQQALQAPEVVEAARREVKNNPALAAYLGIE